MIRTFIIFFFVILATGCANSCKSKSDPIYIAAMNNVPGAGKIGSIRLRFITETATLVGAQGGLAWRSEQINCVLKRQQTQLDDVYNFRALMLKDDIRPPVLEEGQQELTLNGCEAIRTAEQIYRLVSPPCFVTAPPNWRDYLWMRFCQPESPDMTLLPKSTEEAAVWNCYVATGWQQGVDQANQIFTENVSRLNRDYRGMVLYRKLLAQNMVTPPFVAKTDLGITGDANELRINDRILRIAATSQLNPNADTWKPVVAKTGPDEVCCPLVDKVVDQAARPQPKCAKIKKRIKPKSCR